MTALFNMREFHRFLEDASDRQLTDKRDLLIRFIEEARDPDVIAEAKYLLRKVEEEILSRL